MRKVVFSVVVAIVLLFVPSIVFAQGTQLQDRVQDPSSHPDSTTSPQTNQIQNQEREQERLMDATGEGSQNRNQNAVQNMSEVATQVQNLLQNRFEGGLGEQVRTIAREQIQAQEQIQTQLEKMVLKSNLWKKLFGPDYKAIKNLNQQIEQNRLRIQTLQAIQNQLSNQGDKTQLEEAIQSLVVQNTNLQQQIQTEEKTGSLLGWLVKLFYR